MPDLASLLRQLNVDYRDNNHHHCRQGWIQIDCPRCSPKSNRFRLGINIKGVYASCWKCGPTPLGSALAQVSLVPYAQIKVLLSDVPKAALIETKPKGKLILPNDRTPLRNVHKKYLASRGYDPDELETVWGIQAIGVQGGNWRNRIFIPIHHHNEIVSWTTRAASHTAATRYLAAPATHESVSRKELLYGAHLASGRVCIIVEGPFDAWAIGPGAVATLGLAFSAAQVNLMTEFHTRIICFDNEPDANAKAKKLANDLSAFPGETYVVRLPYAFKDAGTLPKSEIEKLQSYLR